MEWMNEVLYTIYFIDVIMTSEELNAHLKRFGLREKEIDVYLVLLEAGPTTVNEIASQADVSRRHVYTVVKKLEEHHFVEINDYITPTVIQPTSPDLIHEKITSSADEMRDKLRTNIEPGTPQTDGFEVLKSRKTVIKRIRQILREAEGQVIVTIPETLISILTESLTSAVDRGVFVLLLVFQTGNGSIDLSDVELESIAHLVRTREVEIPVLVSVDHTCALVAPRGVITQPNSQVQAVRLGQSYIEPIISKSVLNTDWSLGEEVYVTTACELPETFTSFKHAVFQSYLHERNGTSLKATVEARHIGANAESTYLTGQVVKIEQRIVNPPTTPVIGKCSLRIQVDGNETVSLGGPDAYMEDYGANRITLERLQ